MRLYKCNNCGALMEREEVAWHREKYDEPAFSMYPSCRACGSDDITVGESCEWCDADLAVGDLGAFHVCAKCRELILGDISKEVDEFAHRRGVDYLTAKEWFIGWADANW